MKTVQLATLLGPEVRRETIVEKCLKEFIDILPSGIEQGFASIELKGFPSQEM